LGKLGDILFF